MANRSELYRHYATNHYSKQLRERYGGDDSCRVCGMDFSSSITSLVRHMGQTHGKVEKWLPEAARLPQEKIMKRTKEKTMREDTKERKEAKGMAEQPEQSTPSPSVSKGKTRASRRRRGGVGRGAGCVVARRVLGFWVEREVVVDEPPGPCPDTGGARCAVCGADFPGTRSVVEHLAREHGVRSRPPLLLTARRLQEAGYFLPGTQGDQEEPRGV